MPFLRIFNEFSREILYSPFSMNMFLYPWPTPDFLSYLFFVPSDDRTITALSPCLIFAELGIPNSRPTSALTNAVNSTFHIHTFVSLHIRVYISVEIFHLGSKMDLANSDICVYPTPLRLRGVNQ